MKNKLQTLWKKPFVPLLFLFSLIFLRYLFFGWDYYYMLDDYIQHHNYVLTTKYQWGETWATLQRMGLLSYRPLAGILDLSLWSLLFEEMIWGVALLTLGYALSGLLFYRLFREIFSCSPLFLAIYCLIPLGFEGTYWMSASTRILPPLCFLSLALHFFHRYCKEGASRDFWLFFLFQCLSYCFYEQCLVLSITAVVLLSLYHGIFFKSHRLRALGGLSFLLSALLYYVFTSQASSSAMVSSRTEFIFPSPYYYEVFLPDLLEQLKKSFLYGGFYTLYTGFFRGISLIFAEQGYLYLILALILPCGLWCFPLEFPDSRKPTQNSGYQGKRLETSEKKQFFSKFVKNPNPTADQASLNHNSASSENTSWEDHRHHSRIPPKTKVLSPFTGFFVGFLLFLAPISMFFIIANPWFSLRGTVPSFCGIALMIDMLFRLCFGRLLPRFPQCTAVILGICSLIASVSELHDYKASYENDMSVISALYPYVSAYDKTVEVAVLGVEPSFLTEVNFQYHEHFHGVTESQWALSGALTMVKDDTGAKLMPFPVEGFGYYPYHGESKYPEKYQYFYHYHHETATITPLEMKKQGEGLWEFYGESGLFATLEDQDGYGKIILH